MIDSSEIFIADDLKDFGWTPQKAFLLEYERAIVAKRRFLNATEVGVLIYDTVEDAKTRGVQAAALHTFHNEDGGAPGDGAWTALHATVQATNQPSNRSDRYRQHF